MTSIEQVCQIRKTCFGAASNLWAADGKQNKLRPKFLIELVQQTNNAWTQECGTCADRVQGVRSLVIFNIYWQWISAKIPSTIKDAKKWCGGFIVHSVICKTQRQTWTSKYLKTSFNVVLCDINSTWLERVFCGRQSFFWKGLLQIPTKSNRLFTQVFMFDDLFF